MGCLLKHSLNLLPLVEAQAEATGRNCWARILWVNCSAWDRICTDPGSDRLLAYFVRRRIECEPERIVASQLAVDPCTHVNIELWNGVQKA